MLHDNGAMSFRIATFNAENLMERFDFTSARGDDAVLSEVMRFAHDDDSRQLKALAIAACRADIVVLQEVENEKALRQFQNAYLYPMTGVSYPQIALREGNDRRGIDVALMARDTTAAGESIEIVRITSHRDARYATADVFDDALKATGVHPNERLFKRDCLEVDLRIGGKPLTVYCVHFKSMGASRGETSGRERTRAIRAAEARAVRGLIEARFGDRSDRMRWIIAGDLNDYDERIAIVADPPVFKPMPDDASALEVLVGSGFGHNLASRLPPMERWTLFHASGEAFSAAEPFQRPVRHLVQLDYLLASPALAQTNPDAVPDIVRNGQPYRVPMPDGQGAERWPRIGWTRPKGSDHCPVAVTLRLG